MSLSTCEYCGGHIPLGPDATNRCEKCGKGIWDGFDMRVLPASDRWQKRCLEVGFKYWRAPDAHGVTCTPTQAVELLQEVLGVEVEIKDAPIQPAKSEPLPGCDCPECGRGHMRQEVPNHPARTCDHCGDAAAYAADAAATATATATAYAAYAYAAAYADAYAAAARLAARKAQAQQLREMVPFSIVARLAK